MLCCLVVMLLACKQCCNMEHLGLVAAESSWGQYMQPGSSASLSHIYQRILATWTSDAPPATTDARLQWAVRHHRQIAARIQRYANVNSRKVHYQALAAVLKVCMKPQLAQQYAGEAARLHKLSVLAESSQSLSPSERSKWVPFSVITAKARELEHHVKQHPFDIHANFQFLALAMYSLQPPIRREYCSMQIVCAPPRSSLHNFLQRVGIGSYTVILNKDKVSRCAGAATFKLSKRLGNIIDSSLQRFPRKYLFSQRRCPGKPMNSQCFDRLLAGIWPLKKVTVNVLRSAYVTAYHDRVHDLRKRDILAKKMRHSRATAELYYYKSSDHAKAVSCT